MRKRKQIGSESFEIPSAGFSVTAQLRLENKPGMFASVVRQIARIDASLAEVSLHYSDYNYNIRELTINCKNEEHSREIVEKISQIKGVELLSWKDDTFEIHHDGKLEIGSRLGLETTDDLARAYTPGVARVCTAIYKNPKKALDLTIKGTTVAVVSDGSAVLGLGNIGPEAAMPVMEGKALLFKRFAGINAFPICLNTQDTEEIIQAVKNLEPVFGGINLEDISAPRCFEIEERLDKELGIPVFHDDQHGTAIVVLAGLLNALKLTGKKASEVKIVVNGFGAGGVACTRMILEAGMKNIVPCDSAGIVYRGRTERMNPVKEELIQLTNPDNIKGGVADALKGADVFIGVSRPGAITRKMVKSMARDPIVFALANPVPEIMPDEIKGIARVIATGRSDYANQVNNVLAFPGIFKGALEARATTISAAMKVAAAEAIAEAVPAHELHETHIIPSVFQGDIASLVADRVREVALSSD